MFRPKRSPLIRRLLNASLIDQSEVSVPRTSPIGDRHDAVPAYDWLEQSRENIPTLWAATEAILKLIPDSDLEELVGMVEEHRQNGRHHGAPVNSGRRCVRLPRRQIDRGAVKFIHPRRPQTIISLGAEELMCAHWRWPDMIDQKLNSRNVKLKCNFYCNLPCPDQDISDLCLNPFHWSRECVIDYPPPPYSASNPSPPPLRNDLTSSPHRTPDVDSAVISSTETGATLQGIGSCVPRHLKSDAPFDLNHFGQEQQQPWCSAACWSFRRRVGPQITITPHRYHLHPDQLFAPTPASPTLADPSPPGIVLTLTRAPDPPHALVFLYNETGGPVFVDGPQRSHPAPSTCTPQIRVAPGHCVRLYPPASLDQLIPSTRSHVAGVARISVGKGWGPGYSRQIVESCPKWIELTLFLLPPNS